MRKLARLFRWLLTAVSGLLFLGILLLWALSVSQPRRYVLERWDMANQAEWEGIQLRVEGGRMEAGYSGEALDGPCAEVRREIYEYEMRGWHLSDGKDFPFGPGRLAVTFGPNIWEAHRFKGEDFDATEFYSAFPCWMAAIVFGALPAWRGFSWWRSCRWRRWTSLSGRCGVCGYDLRASPERCPECGTVVGGKDHRRDRPGTQ